MPFELFQGSFLGQGLEAKELQEILRVPREAVFRAGETVLSSESPTEDLWWVLEGEIEVRPTGSPMDIHVRRVLVDGDVFGAWSLCGVENPRAELKAKRLSRFLRFPKDRLTACLKANPTIHVKLVSNLLKYTLESQRGWAN